MRPAAVKKMMSDRKDVRWIDAWVPRHATLRAEVVAQQKDGEHCGGARRSAQNEGHANGELRNNDQPSEDGGVLDDQGVERPRVPAEGI